MIFQEKSKKKPLDAHNEILKKNISENAVIRNNNPYASVAVDELEHTLIIYQALKLLFKSP